jgi:Dual specificity phosphatase, catalytic domain.
MLVAKITNNLYIGEAALTRNEQHLASLGVDAIVNLSLDHSIHDHLTSLEIYSYPIFPGELLDYEIPSMVEQLKYVSAIIDKLLTHGRTVLVCCDDGRNVAPLAVGFYLLTKGKESSPQAMIKKLTNIYVDAAKDGLIADASSVVNALTLYSYRKILANCGEDGVNVKACPRFDWAMATRRDFDSAK